MRPLSLSFIKDLGFIGQPHETFIYGVGNRGISYLQDGVLWNNRYSNSLDLNLVQSEDIDSIEIVPSPRGFLYGPYNNPVAVNFIMRDFLSPQPYTRIRYYEGPNGEAMIDGKFNAQIAKRWNLSFQVTNRSVDETYKNTDLSIWQANAKLKYLLSNSVNISGSYYFVSSNQGLNGGVDYDSLSQISNNPNTDLYDPAIAPVLYPNRTLDVTQHNFSLRTLAKPFDNAKLELSIYYRYSLDEYKNLQDSITTYENKNNKSYGAVLYYYHRYEFLTLKLLADYESRNLELATNYGISIYSNSDERFSFGGIVTACVLENFIHASIYYKRSYWRPGDFNYDGIGADILFWPTEPQTLYLGYSNRKEISIDQSLPTFEMGLRYNLPKLMIDIKYYYNEFDPYKFQGGPSILRDTPVTIRALGLSFNYKLWLLLLETNTSYYFKVENENAFETGSRHPKNLPNWLFSGGLYVNAIFFNNNLDLKVGFKYYYIGEIISSDSYYGTGRLVEPSNKLDFILIGEIQERAIVYFVWENLFDNQYFITPYYPMPESSIRFGLSWELFN